MDGASNGSRGRRAARARVLVLLLAGIAPGCSDPWLAPEVDRSLHRADEFRPECAVTQPPTPLEATPVQPPAELVDAAKRVTSPGPQTPTFVLDLPNVRVSAVQFNLDLHSQEYNPEIARQSYEGEFGKFESVFQPSVTRNGTFDANALETTNTELNPTVSVPTRAGGFVTLGFPMSREFIHFVGPNGVQDFRSDTTEMDVGISQPLLRNAGFRVNYASINVLGLAMRQADAQTRLTAIQLLATVEQDYWNYYQAYELLKVQLEQYDVALEQLRIARRLVEEGVLTKIEIIRAEAGLAQRLDAVVQAELTRRLAERELKRVMNRPDLPVTSADIIIPATAPAPFDLRFDRPRVLDLAMKNRMELFQNELQMLQQRYALMQDKSAALPDVTLNYQYSFIGTGPNQRAAWDTLFKKGFDTYTMGLVASVPLSGNVRAQAQVRQDYLRIAQTGVMRRSLELNIQEEVLNAVDSVEQNWQKIIADRAAVVSNRENYEANKRQFEQGIITGNELVLVQTQLITAETTLVQSLTAYQNAIVDAAVPTGTVLGGSGVVWRNPCDWKAHPPTLTPPAAAGPATAAAAANPADKGRPAPELPAPRPVPEGEKP